MRRMSMMAVLFAGVFMASMVHGVGVRENFSGYPITSPASPTSDWYYYVYDQPTDTMLSPAYALSIGDADITAGVENAGLAFLSTDTISNPLIPNTVRIETNINTKLTPSLEALSFSSRIALVGSESYGPPFDPPLVTPASAVTGMSYYVSIDWDKTDGLQLPDSYYITSLPIAADRTTLQWYETSLVDGSTTWQQYDWNLGTGTWDAVGSTTYIDPSITADMIMAGIEFNVGPLATEVPAGSATYMNLWVDDVSVVPEPSALVLAGLGAVGALLRRRRRTA